MAQPRATRGFNPGRQAFNPGRRLADQAQMDPERVLDVGERGIHLLFETPMITEAFGQDADRLRAAVDGRLPDIQSALREISELEPLEARRFVAELEPPLRHILILLYFDLLDGRLRVKPVLH